MPGVQFNKFELNFVKGKVKVNPGTISLLGYYRVTYMVVEKSFVDIKLTVPFQYKPLVLKRNFKIAVNKSCSWTIQVTL